MNLFVAACLVQPALAAPQRTDDPASQLDIPILVDVQLPGLKSYSKETVLRVLGLEIGKPLAPPHVRGAMDAFGLFLSIENLEEVEGGVRLTMRVRELPSDIEPRFLGNDSYELPKILEWAGIGSRDFIYLHETDQIVNRLIAAYKAQGFHFVEAEWQVGPMEPESSEADIIFVIREGPKVRSTGLVVRGNESLPDTGFWIWSGGLRKLSNTQTKGRGLFSWFGRVFREDELNADLQAMRQTYRDRGFLDVKVDLERYEFNEKRNRVKVHVIVDEGPLWRIGSLRLQAFERGEPGPRGEPGELIPKDLVFPEEELLDLLAMKAGEPFESGRLTNDQRVLTEHYGREGYIAAQLFEDPSRSGGFSFLDPDLIRDPETKEVHLTYRMVQGRPRVLREVEFEGNLNTRDWVLRSNVQSLPGQVVDQAKLARAQRRLLNTQYFTNPQDPSHPPPRFRLRSVEGEPDQVDVLFEVEQGLVVNATLSGGANSDGGLVGIASVSMENFDISALPSGPLAAFGEIYSKEAFHGAGQTFSLEVSPGSEIDQWSVNFNERDIFRTYFNPTGAGVSASGRERRFRSNDESRVRLNPYLSHVFDEGDFSGRVGLVWQRVKIRNLDENEVLPSTLVGSEGSLDYLGLNLELRWSDLDNRRYPRNGTFTRLGTTFFGGPLGQDVNVIKSELVHDRYWELGDNIDDVSSVIYLGLAAGVADPFDDTEFVPYSERFFLGGSVTMRGFRFRGVGPNEGRFSLGGESMLRGTLEYRRPLFTTPLPGTTRRQEILRGGPFLDFGVLGPGAWEVEGDDFRVSAGLSIGLTNPIPLVFNFGWPLQDGEGDEPQVFTFRLSLR